MQPYSLPADDLDHVLAHTRDLWESVRGGRVFLTGGTGFFGRWLFESFLWANERLALNAEIVVLSRDPAGFLRKSPRWANFPGLTFHQGEMDRFQFPDGAFTHVIHAATENYPATVGPECLAVFDRNIQGTRRVLDFACSCGVRRFLLTSSGAVYGRQPSDLPCIPEEYAGGPDPLDVHLGYGQGKRVSEYLCALYGSSHDMEIAVARCFAFVGPYLPLDSNFAIGNFLRDALAGGPIGIQGDGSPRRSYLYAADLAIWLWTILLRGTPNRAYNVGSDVDVSIAELAKEVVTVVAPQAEVHIALPHDPNRPVSRYVPSICRAREELGLDVLIALDDALARTAAWHRGNSS